MSIDRLSERSGGVIGTIGPIGGSGVFSLQERYALTADNYEDVSLYLKMNGANGSTTFYDSSLYGHAVTPYGDASISTAVSKFGGASAAFDGYNDYLSAGSGNDLAFGTGDFTIEMFVRRAGDTNAGPTLSSQIIDFRTAEPSEQALLYVRGSGVSPSIDFRFYVNGADRLVSTTKATLDEWRHVAVVRESGVTRLFIDGVSEGGTWADTTNYTATNCFIGGRFAAISGDFRSLNGYIDDLRITKGRARYTSNFTPPQREFRP